MKLMQNTTQAIQGAQLAIIHASFADCLCEDDCERLCTKHYHYLVKPMTQLLPSDISRALLMNNE